MTLEDMDNDWKAEASKLAGMQRGNPFSVPDGYFESLTNQIKSQAFLADLHSGNATGKFTVPEGYFDNLPSQIEGKLAVERFKQKFSANSFTVPEEYFSKLRDSINAKIDEPAKVVSMQPQKRLAWISYAAAACITIGVSSILYFNDPEQKTVPEKNIVAVHQTDLSNISDDDIVSYLQIHSTRADMPVIIENLSEEIVPAADDIPAADVEAYLDNNL